MRVAIYTLTRDRLAYTKRSFESLHKFAGHPFDHYVLDNGSTDGTRDWLEENRKNFKWLHLMPENVGISKGSNICIDAILLGDYDLIIKMDNDCELVMDDTLSKIVSIFEDERREFGPRFILSPRVEGINTQPTRGRETLIGGYTIGLTAIVGGLFHCVPADIYRKYRYNIHLPKAKGQDDEFCAWFKERGGEVGYIETVPVWHMDGTEEQAKKFPEYFQRKWKEENETAS